MSNTMVNRIDLGGLVWKYSFTSIKRANAFINFAKKALPNSKIDITIFRDSKSNPTLRLFVSLKEYNRVTNKMLIDKVVDAFNQYFGKVHVSHIDDAIENCSIKPLFFKVEKDVGIDISIMSNFNPMHYGVCRKDDRIRRKLINDDTNTIVLYLSKNYENLRLFKALIEDIDKVKCEDIRRVDEELCSFKCSMNTDFVSIRDQSLSLAKIYNNKTENAPYQAITDEVYKIKHKK